MKEYSSTAADDQPQRPLTNACDSEIYPGEGGVSHIKRRACSSYLLGVIEKAVLVALRLFSLKRSSAEALAVTEPITYDRKNLTN